MMKCLKAGIVGGLIVFVWSVISWMALPWHHMTLHNFKDEKVISAVIGTGVSKSGMYVSPDMSTGEAKAKTPMIFAAVVLEGEEPSMTMQMVIGLINQIIAAFFVAWLLTKTNGLSYMGRVGFVVMVALTAALMTEVPYWNWFRFEYYFTLVQIGDLLIGWFLAGLVMAKICKK